MIKHVKIAQFVIFISFLFLSISFVKAQTPVTPVDGRDKNSVNTITTAVPFLMITPDSRAGGMGDAGVATTPDVNSIHWNPAKLAFTEKDLGLAVSYTPWLRQLIGDISLSYLAGYKRIDRRSTLGFSLLYFSLGSIQFTDIQGTTLKDHTPNEFALDVAYSLLLSRNLSGGVSLRYIYSNLTGGLPVQGIDSHAGKAFAGDVSVYYQNKYSVKEKNGSYAFGMNISNMGTKVSYTDDTQQYFLPTNLRLGVLASLDFDAYNNIAFTMDLNKLLVPTPPFKSLNGTIVSGKDPDVSVPTGMLQSFYDAPGGTAEEFHEITYSVGLEYWYAKQFAVRSGYFNENQTKGNRKYFTVGLGLKLNVFSLDFAYLIPTTQQNPLQNTLRFSLGFNFDGMKKKEDNTSKNKQMVQ